MVLFFSNTTSPLTLTHRHTGKCMHAHSHSCTHTYVHTCVRARTHTHTHTYAHTHSCPRTRTHTHTRTQAHTHTPTHTHTHTHTHTRTQALYGPGGWEKSGETRPKTTLSPRERLRIKMGSDEGHANISLTVTAKSERQYPSTTTFED